MNKSHKSYPVAVSLSAIFGILGIHHFYLGRWLHGIADLSMSVAAFILIAVGGEVALIGIVILAVDLIHTFIVTILLLVGAYKDGAGNVVTYPGQELNTKTTIN